VSVGGAEAVPTARTTPAPRPAGRRGDAYPEATPTMQPSRYALALRRGWRLLVAGSLLGVLAGLAFTARTAPTYRASTSVFFAPARGDTVSELTQGSTYTQNLMQSFAKVTTQPEVLNPVIQKLGLQTTPRQLAMHITADAQLNTVVLTISVTSSGAQQAADIANAVGVQLQATVQQLTPSGTGGVRPINVTTVATAQVPQTPTGPSPLRNALYGLIAGLAVGVLAALARHLLDDRVRNREQAEALTGLAVLTTVAYEPGRRRSPRNQTVQDAFRRLRTNFATGLNRPAGSGTSVVVTSSIRGEGRSTTAVQLARALAESGSTVLLVDADLRRPRLAAMLSLPEQPGLHDVLVGGTTLGAAALAVPHSSLRLLSAGRAADDPGAALASPAMRALLAEAARNYDAVVLDTPPVLEAADSLVLGQHADALLVVVDASRLRARDLTACLHQARLAALPIAGVVLNKDRAAPRSAKPPRRKRPRVAAPRALGFSLKPGLSDHAL
jgi:succinoglycan biosynthesis transport protein ExoP